MFFLLIPRVALTLVKFSRCHEGSGRYTEAACFITPTPPPLHHPLSPVGFVRFLHIGILLKPLSPSSAALLTSSITPSCHNFRLRLSKPLHPFREEKKTARSFRWLGATYYLGKTRTHALTLFFPPHIISHAHFLLLLLKIHFSCIIQTSAYPLTGLHLLLLVFHLQIPTLYHVLVVFFFFAVGFHRVCTANN